MSCHISSEKLNNPLLKELLSKLTSYFSSIHSDFYVIGATARDIILTAIHEQEVKRSTSDLDIAIAIPDWAQFDSISTGLCQIDGFEKSKEQRQRFIYNRFYLLDIVPFGAIAKDDNTIYWPPEEDIAMSVLGFTEVTNDVLEITIDAEFSVRVVQLPGIFLLKLNAFKDRHLTNNKDADDIAYIISNYLEANENRAIENYYSEIYDVENFQTFTAGAVLLGKDIKALLSRNQDTLDSFIEILTSEIEKEEESILINQMLEIYSSLKYEDVINALQCLLSEMKS
jgi:Uncharacterized protein conserved in bacteria